jgi:hypothetical protein
MFADAKVEKIGGQLQVTHGQDDNLYVEFSNEPVKMEFESEQQGRPIFKEMPYIRIMFPGDRTKEVFRPVEMGDYERPGDPERFPKQWARFQNQEKQVADGTPVEQWAVLNRSEALALKAVGVFTVELLASLPDQALHGVGLGGRELREKARNWLKQATDGSEVTRLTAENKALRDDLEMVKKQIAELSKSASEDDGDLKRQNKKA